MSSRTSWARHVARKETANPEGKFTWDALDCASTVVAKQ